MIVTCRTMWSFPQSECYSSTCFLIHQNTASCGWMSLSLQGLSVALSINESVQTWSKVPFKYACNTCCLCNWWENWFYVYVTENRLEEAASGLDLHSVYWIIECGTVCSSRVLVSECCQYSWRARAEAVNQFLHVLVDKGKASALYKPKPVSKRRYLRNCVRRILC